MAVFFDSPIEITGLTGDSTWRDKSLSGSPYNLPANATGVMLLAVNTHASNNYTVGVRKKGSTNDFKGTIDWQTQTPLYIGCDSAQTIQYYISSTSIKLYLIGYFSEDAVFFDNGTLINDTVSGWTTKDLSSIIPSEAKAAILYYYTTSTGSPKFGTRPYGSSEDGSRWGNTISCKVRGAIVGCDANRNIQINTYTSSSNEYCYVVGYLKSGVFPTTMIDKSLSVGGTYQDISLASDNAKPLFATGVLWRIDFVGGTYSNAHIRPDGGSTDLYYRVKDNIQLPVRLSDNDIYEGKVYDANTDFYREGYFADVAPPFELSIDGESCPPGNIVADPFEIEKTVPPFSLSVVIDASEAAFDATTDGEGARIFRTYVGPGEFAVSGTAQLEIGSIFSGRFPAPKILATGNTIRQQVDLEGPTIALTARGLTGVTGRARIAVELQLTSLGYDITGNADIFASGIDVSSSGIIGALGESSLSGVEISCVTSGLADVFGSAGISVPACLIYAETKVEFDASAWAGFSVNLANGAVTEYMGFPFNSICMLNGKILGANSSGIFLLDAETDGGVAVDSEVIGGVLDIGLDSLKRARNVWIEGESDGDMLLVVETDENDRWETPILKKGNEFGESRAKIARGLKSRFMSFGFRNENGCDFKVKRLRVIGEAIERRVR